MEDIRSFNVGASDYSKHKYQSWDFWILFALNPFDADLCKRILRTKATDGRLLDYQKIKHICGERIRQLTIGKDVFPVPSPVDEKLFYEMIEDYNLCTADKALMIALLYGENRKDSYIVMQEICDDRIKDLEVA